MIVGEKTSEADVKFALGRSEKGHANRYDSFRANEYENLERDF